MSIIYNTLQRLEAESAERPSAPRPPALQPPAARPLIDMDTAAARSAESAAGGRRAALWAGLAFVAMAASGLALGISKRDAVVAQGTEAPLTVLPAPVVDQMARADAGPAFALQTQAASAPAAGGDATAVEDSDLAQPGQGEPAADASAGRSAQVASPSPRLLTPATNPAQEEAGPAQPPAQVAAVPSAAQSGDASATIASESVTSTSASVTRTSASVASIGAQAEGLEGVLEQARVALSRGRYQQVLALLEPVAGEAEQRGDFWLLRASAHLGLGQLDLAEQGFSAAQALGPDSAQVAIQLAIIRQEQDDHTAALQILEAAALRHPDVPEIYLNLGYSQQALGGQREAARSFRAFLQMTQERSLYTQQRQVIERWLAQSGA